MKTQVSNTMNLLKWNCFAITAALLVTVFCAPCCHAQQKPGWTLVFDDEFNGSNLSSLFYDANSNPNGLWCSMGGCWDPHGVGIEYDVPASPWNPAGCGTPAINTSLTGAGTLKLTARKNPGKYAVWTFNNGTGNVICAPYTYTGALLWSKQTFRYGYFEIRAKIPNYGKVIWPAFWLWSGGGNQYREIDDFEFGDPKTANQMGMNEHLAQALEGGFVAPNHHIDSAGPGINDYPGNFVINSGGDVTNYFHTYAVKWSPNSVTWYVDDQPVRTLAGHSPHLDMYLIADTAIASWNGNPDAFLPAEFEIDYIRAYRSQSDEFMTQWGNDGSKQIHWWNMNPTDHYVSGKFEGNGKAQLLATSTGGWAQMMKFNSSSWDTPWGNGGSGKINWWYTHPTDKYIVGDFAGLGRDQLLAISDDNGWSQLMSYNDSASSWDTPWGNNGSGQIASWYMHKEDQYIAGDFAGLGRDQLLAINYDNGWAQLMEYYGGSWHMIWSNSGNHWISGWYLSPGDKYLSGNLRGNVNGQKELFAISKNGNGYAGLVRYSAGQWHDVWKNGGSGKINWWNMNPTDKYFVGNFDGGNKDQVLAIATNQWGWSQLMSYSSSSGDWDTPWGNDGAGTIDLWYMHPSDMYVPGDFNGHGQKDLFAVGTNGWTHLMQRILP